MKFRFFIRFVRAKLLARNIFSLILLLSISHAAHALDAFVIKEIRVEGLQRISIGTVFNYLPVTVKDRMNDERAKESLRALFATGFFSDVRLSRQGDTLLVTVAERPSILDIKVEGSKKIKPEDLVKTLKEAGLAEGRTFSRSLLDRVKLDLQHQYYSLGYYAVKIDYSVKPETQNRVSITINVSEGRIALIEDIRIVGNQAFSDKKLLNNLKLRKHSAVKNPFSKRDRYSKIKLEADLETLRSYYLDGGYVDLSIDSTQVSVTPDREYVYITIALTEGKKYHISGYEISGETIVPRKELEKLVDIRQGDVFSRKKVVDTTTKLTDRLGDEGYAFARIQARPVINREEAKVSINFFVSPGKRAYVRRIEISGNSITRDEVIRRELRQLEGTWFSSKKLNRSRVRLQRLGFFEAVDVRTRPVAGALDQLDILVNVKEQPTGSIMMGGGYSDANGFFVNLSYNERNAFGTGKSVVVAFDNSQATTTYEFSYNNPYYTKSGINRGINLYSRTVDAEVTQTGNYGTETNGLGVSYGLPFSETRKVSVSLAYEGVKLITDTGSAQVAQDFVGTYGEAVKLIKASIGWTQDSLNNFLFPTEGGLYRVQAEGGTPFGDLQYYQASINGSYYIPMNDPRSTIRFRGQIAYGDGYGDTAELPFFKNYYAGGVDSVRGFRARGLGPVDSVTGDPIGGNKLLTANAEYIFPVPGSPEQGSSMRLSMFFDAGMVYGSNQSIDPSQVRFSSGIAFNWFTPMFPIAISLGFPLNAQPGDLTETFQFSIGLPLQ
jgi:outer membrane protein insertion porin family